LTRKGGMFCGTSGCDLGCGPSRAWACIWCAGRSWRGAIIPMRKQKRLDHARCQSLNAMRRDRRTARCAPHRHSMHRATVQRALFRRGACRADWACCVLAYHCAPPSVSCLTAASTSAANFGTNSSRLRCAVSQRSTVITASGICGSGVHMMKSHKSRPITHI